MSPEKPARLGRAARTREALIRAGRELFSQRPVEGVTIDEIVAAADVAKGSFYNHFPDREAFAREVVGEIRDALEGRVQGALDGVEDPARRVCRAVCVYQRYALDEPERARVLIRISSGRADISAPRNRNMVEDIRAGLASGRFTISTLEAAGLFILGVSQATLGRISEGVPPALAVSLVQQMCALILRGLGVPSAEAETIAAQSADELVNPERG
jgi:AcrR family transcriptional regulator